VKPVASSRGRGIFIVDSVKNVPKHENNVVSRYIDNVIIPMLQFNLAIIVVWS
jgi:hypothetical protein